MTINEDWRGTYALVRSALARRYPVPIGAHGRLGRLVLETGYYGYVGSGFGSGGVPGRVRNHLNPNSPLRWHLDYLKRYTVPAELWFTRDTNRRECAWAELVAALEGAKLVMAGFGSSDCDCPAHFYFFPTRPSFGAFEALALASITDHAPIHRLDQQELRRLRQGKLPKRLTV